MNCRDGKGQRCTSEAEYRLIDPDGKTQGRMCLQHIMACINEYRDKLQEQWYYEAIEPWES
jgi:hypothetical protein